MLNDRLIVPSQCFRNKLVFLSLWIRVLLFPLHFLFMRTAIWFHCSLKRSESNFLYKTDTRKPDFPLEIFSSWRVAPGHLVVREENINRSKGGSKHLSSLRYNLRLLWFAADSLDCGCLILLGRSSDQKAAEVVLMEPLAKKARATGFLCGFDRVCSGRDAEIQWAIYWMWLFSDKSEQGGCYRNSPEMRLLWNSVLRSPNHHQITA